MPKRINWYILLGVFFSVIGVLSLFANRPIDAAWNLAIGVGNLFIGYAQTHTLLGKRALWVVTIIWLIVIVALTILKLQTP